MLKGVSIIGSIDMHKQIHRAADGRDMITLEGMEVYPKQGCLF